MIKRRAFLGGVSIAAMSVSCGWPALSSAIEVASEDNSALSFVGPNLLLIIVYDVQLSAPDLVAFSSIKTAFSTGLSSAKPAAENNKTAMIAVRNRALLGMTTSPK